MTSKSHEHALVTGQQLQARLTDCTVTASLLHVPVPVSGNVDHNLRLRVSAFAALAFDFNSRRRIIILFPVLPISRQIFSGFGKKKHMNFPRNAGKEFPQGNTTQISQVAQCKELEFAA
jgi:hypothetical protein